MVVHSISGSYIFCRYPESNGSDLTQLIIYATLQKFRILKCATNLQNWKLLGLPEKTLSWKSNLSKDAIKCYQIMLVKVKINVFFFILKFFLSFKNQNLGLTMRSWLVLSADLFEFNRLLLVEVIIKNAEAEKFFIPAILKWTSNILQENNVKRNLNVLF